jgi:hypothetical protein
LSWGKTSGGSDDNIAFDGRTVPFIRLLQETDFSFDGSIDFQIAGYRTEDEAWNDTKGATDQLVFYAVLTANQ